MAYSHLRADLVAALVLADGKDRARALQDFDDELNAPLGGWQEADRKLIAAIQGAPF